jgi:hypothetical protein
MENNFVLMLVGQALKPSLVLLFGFAVVMRFLVYITVRRHEWFAKEFEKRVNKFVATYQDKKGISFYGALKRNLERTFYELFKVRAVMKRRRPDLIMDPMDRVFLVKQGSAWIVKEVLRQVRNLSHKSNFKSHEITKTVFQNNPCYSKVFGVIPMGGLNELLNLLPGLFVVLGIFGTFIGISEALPGLGSLEITNPEATKKAIDSFLGHIGFAMTASIYGIFFSIVTNVLNSMWSPDRVFVGVVDRFENTLDLLWELSDNNDSPLKSVAFEENKDPLDALAEEYLKFELDKGKGDSRNGESEDQPITTKSA